MLFRNHFLVRTTACFLLLEIVCNLAIPTVTLAMAGPSQPEYTSYEASGSTDMVNLATGDFSYSVPVLDIPGPERSFSLPLTYKAGIQLEQEASWVGLGWSLNAGAIARDVNGYPDDADNEPAQMYFQKTIQSGGSQTIIPGIWNTTWNSNTGRAGSFGLLGLASINWDKDGLAGGDLVGVGYQKGQGMTIDPVQMVAAAATIASFGAATPLLVADKVGLALTSSIVIGATMGAFGIGRMEGVSGFNNTPSLYKENDLSHTYYRQHVTTNITERRYGSLYFGKMSQANNANPTFAGVNINNIGPNIVKGTATGRVRPFDSWRSCSDDTGMMAVETGADIHQYGDLGYDGGTRGYYTSDTRPISIAHDYYSVMGQEVTGTIRPYRLEVGSVAYPQMGVDECEKQIKYSVIPYLDNYKVPFRYEGSLSNKYDYHRNTTGSVATGLASSNSNVVVSDPSLLNARTEPAREGLNYNNGTPQLVQGKHVIWYSNREIELMAGGSFAGYTNGFVNFETPTASNGSNDIFRKQLPPQGIGAYSVTAENGSTYHYSLPVYQFRTFTESNEILPVNPAGSTRGTSSVKQGFPYNNTQYGGANPNTHGGYATTWLLTAITSPDYIDRNNSGTVDEGDWGGWVKLSYGKFSSRYAWRQPYIGESIFERYASHTEGYKETYYLDRISTRTHTALFVKSIRNDARGHFTGGFNAILGIDESHPASSLRLDEIILLDNSGLKELETADGIRQPSDPIPTPAFTNNTLQNGGSESLSGDALGRVLDGGDLTADARIRAFVEAKAIRRIRFNYNYELCPQTVNSFPYRQGITSSLPPMQESTATTNRTGKLSLQSLSFFGPTVGGSLTKIIPDFIFGYTAPGRPTSQTNPPYNKDKWDAFGMYMPSGNANSDARPADATAYAAPWTLTSIKSPLGATTTIAYERDEYGSISDFVTGEEYGMIDTAPSGSQGPNGVFVGTGTVDLTKYFKVGDRVQFAITVTDEYFRRNVDPNSTMPQEAVFCGVRRDGIHTITALSANSIIIDNPPATGGVNGCSSNSEFTFTYTQYSGTSLSVLIPKNIVGGNIRVASVKTQQGVDEYNIKYKYTNNMPVGSNSTGTISKTPPRLEESYREKRRFAADELFDYPSTPVLYGRVSVLKGNFRAGNERDFDVREVYDFYTPKPEMITNVKRSDYGSRDLASSYPGRRYDGEFFSNDITVNTGLIGRPKVIAVYDKAGHAELSTTFQYATEVSNPNGIAKQGHYTEGAMTNELLNFGSFRTNRTTKEYVPTVLASSTSTKNGVSITNRNELYDFYSGDVLATSFRNSRNQTYHSVSVPAYTIPIYASMGPKAENTDNSHMLTQIAANYLIKEIDNSGFSILNPFDSRSAHIISAGVQTWQQNWFNYRILNATGQYQDDVNSNRRVWRESASYAWQSTLLNTDGSFGAFIPYNWNGPNASHWLKVNEALRYDHYSHLLESRGVDGLFSAMKLGYNNSQSIASATNARYTELAYSGAEDAAPSMLTHFGGEVVGGIRVSTPNPHTGLYSSEATPQNNGFSYQAVVGMDVVAGKQYRLGAWIYKNDIHAPLGRLFASVGGNLIGESSINSVNTKSAGDWSRLDLTVTIPPNVGNGEVITFGCRNTSTGSGGNVHFDDFRVCPLGAVMKSNVYDPKSNRLTYELDNENLYTQYEYDNTGKLITVYREFLDKPNERVASKRKVKEYINNYARTAEPNWLTNVQCQLDINGKPTGFEETIEKDINSASPSAGTVRSIRIAQSSVCIPCNGLLHWKLVNGVCEAGVEENSCEVVTTSPRQFHVNTTKWRYSDGSYDNDVIQSTRLIGPCPL